MARYHISPKTGNPGVCRAVQSCPFGGDADHYSTPAEARQAFEDLQASQLAPKLEKQPPVHKRAFTAEDFARFARDGATLIELMSPDGNFEFPNEQDTWWDEDEDGEDVLVYEQVQVGDFRLLASGAGVNAYLHEPTATVYKVPHFESIGEDWGESAAELLADISEGEQKSYQRLDHDLLATENVTYTPTHYFSVPTEQGALPLIAQAYLDPQHYEAHSLTGTEQNRMATALGVWDLNRGNVRQHRLTGELVLLDCIPAWDA